MNEMDIVVVEDDNDYYRLVKDILTEIVGLDRFQRAKDGEEFFGLLGGDGRFSSTQFSIPSLILLDWHMPRMNGLETLKQIRKHHQIGHVPVVVMSASSETEDIDASYRLGANSFILKGNSFSSLKDKLQILCGYWLETVELPRGDK